MVENSLAVEQSNNGNGEIEEKARPKYLIDPEMAVSVRRSLPMLVSSRRCYLCQQADDERSENGDPDEFIERIADHCSQQQDYMLPDTPLKDAIFRVILSHRNEPMDAEEISAVLTEAWAMTPFPRVTTPDVVQRLLDNSRSYCVARLPEPEPEIELTPEPEPEPDPAPVAAVESESVPDDVPEGTEDSDQEDEA